MRVPHKELQEGTLTGVIEEYVTRDGTDLSDSEAKIAKVRQGLDRGELVIVFDPETESCNIVPSDWPDLPDDTPD
jgi:uncharacterized protein YheU (UPF0270 family)